MNQQKPNTPNIHISPIDFNFAKVENQHPDTNTPEITKPIIQNDTIIQNNQTATATDSSIQTAQQDDINILESETANVNDNVNANVNVMDEKPAPNLPHADIPPLKYANQTTATLHPKAKANYIETKLTIGKRILNSVLVGGIFAFIGVLVDWAVNFIRAFLTKNANDMVWFFLPCFGVIGVVFGFLFGAKALDVIFANFRATSDEQERASDFDTFETGLLKAFGIGLVIVVIGWLALLILM